MVLPTPPPDDASGANEPAFVTRLKHILQLADRGVLVLVEGAPHALGPIVRGLLPEYPDLLVETRAERLFTAEKGQVVVFVPRLEDAASLNLNRPILSERELKVVLVCDEATAGKLAHAAPDFFHWISHWIEGPKGPSSEVAHRLYGAVKAHVVPIEWIGNAEQLEAAFAAILPEVRLRFFSSTGAFSRLLEVAEPRPKTWIAWTDVEHPYARKRLEAVWQRAGRGGRNVLMLSQGRFHFPDIDGDVVRIDATTLELADAMHRLEKHGVDDCGRLAALVELSRPSVEKIERLLDRGCSSSEIESRLVTASRPWEVLDDWLGLQTQPNQSLAARGRDESDEASLALSLLDRARIFEQQGMFSEAEPLVREALAYYEELFGLDDARTRAAVRQLTHVLKTRGRYGDAVIEWLRVLPAEATTPGPRHPTNHWLYEEDVKAAQDLMFLVSGIRDSELTIRAYEAVRAALGDEAKETKALAAWVERLSAPKDS